MKSIKDIRNNLEALSEAVESSTDTRKLTTLVRAGLFDAHKLTMLKRALNKDNTKMTRAEKDALIQLLDNLLDVVMSNQGVFSKIKQNIHEEVEPPTEEEINEASKYDIKSSSETKSDDKKSKMHIDITTLPALIVMKRRAIRIFPDGQKVALYWADRINRYISVPFSSIGLSEETTEQLNESLTPKDYSDLELRMIRQHLYQKRAEQSNDPKHMAIRDDRERKHQIYLDNLRKRPGVGKKSLNRAINTIQSNIKNKIEKKKEQYQKDTEAYKNEKQMRSIKSVGDIASKHGAAAGLGALVGMGIRKAVTKTPVAPKKPRSITEASSRFKNRVTEIRNESVASTVGKVADVGARAIVPYYDAAREFQAGNYGSAAVSAGIDTAAAALGALAGAGTAGAGAAPAYLGVRAGLKGAAKYLAKKLGKTAAKDAAEVAAKKAAKRAKAIKWAKRAGTAGAIVGGLAGGSGSGGGGDSSSSSSSYKMPQNKANAFAGGKNINIIQPGSDNQEMGAASSLERRREQRQKGFEYGNRKAISESKFSRIKRLLKIRNGLKSLGNLGGGGGEQSQKTNYKMPQNKAQAFAGGKEITVKQPGVKEIPSADEVRRDIRQKRFEYGDRKGISENRLDLIKNINETTNLVYEDGTVSVSKIMAEKIVEVYENLNFKNKKLFNEMINKDKDSFTKIAKFALTNKV